MAKLMADSSHLRCERCGRFIGEAGYKIHQPHTESWKTEPNDPDLLCTKCFTTITREEKGE